MSALKKPHIAIVASFSGAGGVERMLINLMTGFVDAGAEVELLRIKKRGPFADAIPSGVRVHDLPSDHALGNVAALARYLGSSTVDAVLSAKDRSNRAVLMARKFSGRSPRVVIRLGTNLTASLRGKLPVTRWMRCFPSRLLYPDADAVVAVSEGVAIDTAFITKIPLEQILVIPNPVVTDRMRRLSEEPVRHPWFLDRSVPLILGAGRLTRQKDFTTLIRAFALVRQKRPARLVILGEGGERETLKRLAVELGIQDDLDMPGFEKNPYKFMRRAQLFVLSSAWEGSPNVLTEAMALGTPVVATDCPSGARELLRNGLYGPLVNVGSAGKMAEAIEQTLDAPLPSDYLESAVATYNVANSARLYLNALVPECQK